MSNKSPQKKPIDAALIGKQQLLIKAQLRRNALVAKQQLAVKSMLASQRTIEK